MLLKNNADAYAEHKRREDLKTKRIKQRYQQRVLGNARTFSTSVNVK